MSLRKITREDLPTIREWRNSPQIRQHMYSSHKITEEEHYAWFDRLEQDAESRWYIHTSDENIADGVVYFTQLKPSNKSSFWGFYASPEAPLGTGSKIALDALDFVFSELKLHKLNAEVISSNKDSLRFHEKLGFKQEGLFRDYHFDGSSFFDVVRFGIISTEWQKKRTEIKLRIASYEAS